MLIYTVRSTKCSNYKPMSLRSPVANAYIVNKAKAILIWGTTIFLQCGYTLLLVLIELMLVGGVGPLNQRMVCIA